jgi:hypothetical protein
MLTPLRVRCTVVLRRTTRSAEKGSRVMRDLQVGDAIRLTEATEGFTTVSGVLEKVELFAGQCGEVIGLTRQHGLPLVEINVSGAVAVVSSISLAEGS